MSTRTLALSVALSLVSLCHARAGYIDFVPTADASTTAVINFSATGALSGFIPIAALYGDNTPGSNGRTIPISNGVLAFNLGQGYGTSDTVYGYEGGGTVAVFGSLAGGPQETLLSYRTGSSAIYPGEGIYAGDWQQYAPVFGVGNLADDVAAKFGTHIFALSYFGVSFTGDPGHHLLVATLQALTPDAATAPEPASVAMLGMGLVLAAVRRKMSKE